MPPYSLSESSVPRQNRCVSYVAACTPYCERKKRAAEALTYNSLIQSRPEIVRLADEITRQSEQSLLFDERED